MTSRAAEVLPGSETALHICLRGAFNVESDGAIRAAVASVDPRELLALADRHRVIPQLHAVLRRALPDGGPLVEELERRFRRNAACNLALAAELARILAEFRDSGPRVVPFKGVILAERLYGRLDSRASGDLDLLIRPGDAAAALKVLQRLDYRFQASPEAANPHGSEWQLERRGDGLPVELRWRLTSPQFGVPLDLDALAGRLTPGAWRGAPLEELPVEELLVVLCVHGAKHGWSRWMWICDVAQLLAAHPALDWSRVSACARPVGAETCVALGVALARALAGRPAPACWRVRRLAAWVRGRLLGTPGPVPGGWRYWLLLLDRPADRLRVCARLLRAYGRRLRPNVRDVEFVPLPRSLRFLHYVSRPVRLMLETARRRLQRD